MTLTLLASPDYFTVLVIKNNNTYTINYSKIYNLTKTSYGGNKQLSLNTHPVYFVDTIPT
jgi:hypothetical protein